MAAQVAIRVLACELPLDASFRSVSLLLPVRDFCL
jgi:hypothetical protein